MISLPLKSLCTAMTHCNFDDISSKNVFHFLSIIAHGLILSDALSEYTHSMARISGLCILLMSCISEQEDTSELVYISH